MTSLVLLSQVIIQGTAMVTGLQAVAPSAQGANGPVSSLAASPRSVVWFEEPKSILLLNFM